MKPSCSYCTKFLFSNPPKAGQGQFANVSAGVHFAHYWVYASGLGYVLPDLVEEEQGSPLQPEQAVCWLTVKQSLYWQEWEKVFWEASKAYHHHVVTYGDGKKSVQDGCSREWKEVEK